MRVIEMGTTFKFRELLEATMDGYWEQFQRQRDEVIEEGETEVTHETPVSINLANNIVISFDAFDEDDFKQKFKPYVISGINKIRFARKQILKHNPFFSTVMMDLHFELITEPIVARTNGKHIQLNPLLVETKFTQRQTTALLLHEILHCVLLHAFRRGKAGKENWNISADLVVNEIIKKHFSEHYSQQYANAGKKKSCMKVELPETALTINSLCEALDRDIDMYGLKPDVPKTLDQAFVHDMVRDILMMDSQTARPSIDDSGKTFLGGPSTNRFYSMITDIRSKIAYPEEDGGSGDNQPGDGDDDGGDDSDDSENKPPSDGQFVVNSWGSETASHDRVLRLSQTMGECVDFSAESGTNKRQAQLVNTLLAKAAITGKSASMGNQNAAMLLQQTVNRDFVEDDSWNKQFRNLVMDLTRKEDYSWRRPARRWIPQEIYMPSIMGPKDEKFLNIGIDVSGSISDHMLDQMGEELSKALIDIKFRARVICCDTSIKRVFEIDNDDLPIDFDVQAGGGTELSPIVKYITEHKDEAPSTMTIIFTDMCFDHFHFSHVHQAVGGESATGPVVFLNFGYARDTDSYGPKTPTFSNIINMTTKRRRQHYDENDPEQPNLIAEQV
jgi:predicted metal-dependent peptidase